MIAFHQFRCVFTTFLSCALLPFASFVRPSVAVPTHGNSTGSNSTGTVGYVPQDGGRDTPSLVLSCLLTLCLCVYSAIHLNVPAKDEPTWKTRLREFKWCLVGLFGPELVVMAAWRQWESVRELGKRIREVLDAEKGAKDDITRMHSWTMVHGFYACMGGYAIETDQLGENVSSDIFRGVKRLTLTPRGVLLLAQCGHLPDISKEVIKDKSKADNLTKLLVCLQAGWLIVQVVARLATHLPVTLLEVNTIGHVGCALIMYMFWWSKPRQIQEPTLLSGDWVKQLGAYMFISGNVGWENTQDARKRKKVLKKAGFYATARGGEMFIHLPNVGAMSESMRARFPAKLIQPIIVRKPVSPPTRLATVQAPPRHVYEEEVVGSKFPTGDHELTCWLWAGEACTQYPAVSSRHITRFCLPSPTADFAETSTTSSYPYFEFPLEKLVVRRMMNWPSKELFRSVSTLAMGIILWSASMSYGGLHACAWHSYFPSEAERWMWRASSVCLAASGAIWVLINFLAIMSRSIDMFWRDFTRGRARWWWYLPILFLCFVCGVSYLAARVFIVVEAFISVRRLEKAAYETPGWINAVPHL